MEGYLVEEAGMVPACLFYGEKGWPDFSWFPALLHAQPVPSTTAAPLRRACSARCPEVWLDVVHNMELPRLKLITLGASCIREGEPWETARRGNLLGRPRSWVCAASGPAARDGWHQPQGRQPKRTPAHLFSVEKTMTAISKRAKKSESPGHIGPDPLCCTKTNNLRASQCAQRFRASK